MPAHHWLQQVALLLFLGVASYWDCRYRRIPNWLNATGFGVGAAVALVVHAENGDTGSLLLGMVIAVTSLLLLYLGGGVGGGDVKLAFGFGLLSGYPDVVRYLFYGCLAALALVLGRLAWHGEVRQQFGLLLRQRFRILAPGQAEQEAAKPERSRAFTSFALALTLGVIWVWVLARL